MRLLGKIFFRKCFVTAYAAIFFLPSLNAGPQYSFRKIEVEDGLSQDMVYTIIQDKDGFLWFGTQNGLNRYDGSALKIYRSDDARLRSDAIFSLAQDESGKIWVGTLDGLSVMTPGADTFENPAIGDGLVRDIAISDDGYAWLSLSDTVLCRVSCKDLKGEVVSLRPYLAEGSQIRSICLDGGGNVWIAAFRSGLLKLNLQTGKVDRFLYRPEGSLTGNNFSKVFLLDPNTLLVGTVSDGVLSFNLRNQSFSRIPQLGGENVRFVHDIGRDKESRIWVGAENGLHIWTQGDGVTHLVHDTDNPWSISDNAVFSIERDSEGGMWLGTYFGGVNYYSSYASQFEKFFPTGESGSLSGKNVSEFCEREDGLVWVGTEDKGLNLFDPSSGTFKSGFVPSGNIHALRMLDGDLWVGTYSDGLYILRDGKPVEHFEASSREGSLGDNSVYSIYRDYHGGIWIGTERGLYSYSKGRFDRVNQEGINSQVNDILQDFDGNLWFVTMGQGVFRLDISSGEWSNATPEGLGSVLMTTGIMETSSHDLWFSTDGGGIYMYSRQQGKVVKHLTVSDGLPSNVVYKLLSSPAGDIWGSTASGLFMISGGNGAVRTFTHRAGLLCDQYNYKSGFLSKDGWMYWGGVKGFCRFMPDRLKWPEESSRIVFDKFSVSGNDISLTNDFVAKVKPSDHVFTIGFADLAFAMAGVNSYKYMLEGADKEWIAASEPQKVTYSNLPPGRYRFLVEAETPGLDRELSYKAFTIRVLPPFWRSGWAYLLYVMLFCGLASFAVLYLRSKERSRNASIVAGMEREKEKELYDSKIEFFTNITHEIRTPLTLIIMPLEELMKKVGKDSPERESLSVIKRNSDRLLSLVNELLDFKKIGSSELQMNYVHADVEDLLRRSVSSFKSMAGIDRLEIRESYPENRLAADVDVEIFEKIMSNLLSNALKHAATFVGVGLRQDGDYFVTVVSNDGDIIPAEDAENIFNPFVKLDPSSSGSGLGLPFARKLAEAHGGSLRLLPEQEDNKFEVRLPLAQAGAFRLNAQETPETQEEQELETGDGRKVIMVVEDNEEFRHFLSRQLGAVYSVLEASGGEAALSLLKDHQVDLVITDLMMPGMDGMELCSRIKQSLEYSHIPVIMLTAKTDLRTKIEGVNNGADEFLSKPFSSEYLSARIRNLLSSRDKMQKDFSHSPYAEISAVAKTKTDQAFLEKITSVISDNMENQDLDVDDLAKALFMSRATLYRKMKGIVNQTPNDFIRLCRLRKAAELIAEKEYKVNEIAYIVGFSSPSYFTKCFQKQFGVSPKDFVK